MRFLGQGGNGYVVCARDTALDRLVAIKMIFGGTLAAGGRDRLQREGRVLARLEHPAIVQVYSALAIDADLALVTEYVDGPNLNNARAPVAVLLDVLDDVAAAIAHCHQRGVVHRDLKPANVLVTPEGRAKVADFGIARLSRVASAFRTESGVASGTQRFAAPEQLLNPDVENPASDSYSFAVLACRALTTGFGDDLDGIPEPARSALRDALSPDPVRRPQPVNVMAAIRCVPAGAFLSWSEVAPSEPVSSPTVATSSGVTPRSTSSEPAYQLPAAVEIDLPVHQPRPRRRPLPAWLIGAALGVVFTLVVVVVWTVL